MANKIDPEDQVQEYFEEILELNKDLEEIQDEMNILVEKAVKLAEEANLPTGRDTLIESIKSYERS